MLREVRGRQAILKQVQPRDPFSRIKEGRLRLEALEKQVQHQMQVIFEAQYQRITQRGAQLEALDPTAVLGRGYSVTLHNGKSVTDARRLRKGTTITIQFETGKISAKVTRVIAPGDFEQLPLLMSNEE